VKKLALFVALVFSPCISAAENYRLIKNPRTNNLDFVTSLSSASLLSATTPYAFIQNTLTPTTTTQQFSVQNGTVKNRLYVTNRLHINSLTDDTSRLFDVQSVTDDIGGTFNIYDSEYVGVSYTSGGGVNGWTPMQMYLNPEEGGYFGQGTTGVNFGQLVGLQFQSALGATFAVDGQEVGRFDSDANGYYKGVNMGVTTVDVDHSVTWWSDGNALARLTSGDGEGLSLYLNNAAAPAVRFPYSAGFGKVDLWDAASEAYQTIAAEDGGIQIVAPTLRTSSNFDALGSIFAGTGASGGKFYAYKGTPFFTYTTWENVASNWFTASTVTVNNGITAKRIQQYDSTGLRIDVSTLTISQGLNIPSGTDKSMGTANLVAGTVTVSNKRVTSNSRFFITHQSCTNCGTPYISGRTSGTSFTISSTNILDTSGVAWLLIEP
jgi:hypothetical protein